MNISLTPTLENYVRAKVASGLYNNASELVREALRLLLQREANQVKTPQASVPTKANVVSRLVALKKMLRGRAVRSVSIFGSLVRDEAQPGSDIDLIVDIKPGRPFSLVDLVSLKEVLEHHLGYPVDVVTREGLDPLIRERILGEAMRVF